MKRVSLVFLFILGSHAATAGVCRPDLCNAGGYFVNSSGVCAPKPADLCTGPNQYVVCGTDNTCASSTNVCTQGESLNTYGECALSGAQFPVPVIDPIPTTPGSDSCEDLSGSGDGSVQQLCCHGTSKCDVQWGNGVWQTVDCGC
jgi:hypothetical protein